MRAVFRAVICGGVLGGLAGCESKPVPPKLPPAVPVHGRVVYKGKGVEGVAVTLNPLFDIGPVKFAPGGTTDADGRFEINSVGTPGAPVGEYAVTMAWPEPSKDPGDAGNPDDRWKGKYADPAKARWRVKITDGKPELDPFQLD